MRMVSDPTTAAPSVPTISYPGQRLLGAVGTPFELDGAVLAARQIRNHILQAVRIHGAAIPAEWAREAANLYESLQRSAEQGLSTLKALPNSSQASKAYKEFTASRKSSLSLAAAARIDAALGLIIASEAAIARAVSPLVIAAHRTLHKSGTPRSGRHPDWSILVDNFPTTQSEVEAWAKRDTEPRLQAFMAALASALRSPPMAPSALAIPGTATERGLKPVPATNRGEHGGANKPTRHAIGQAASEDDDLEPTGSLIGWLRARADQAGYLSRWGAEGRWERQTKNELTAVCMGVREALAPGHPHRIFAFFATVSLATSLPARRTSELKLSRNTDIWLDLQLGAVRWYLKRLLDAEFAASAPLEWVNDQDVVDIWLPSAAARVGFELMQARSLASDLLELLTGSTCKDVREDFLERYRAWLHSIGYESMHGVEDARFGRSLGQFYREQSGDVIAALLSLDFEEVSIGSLHYVQLNRSLLHEQCDLAWQRVGLGPATPLALPDWPIGSKRALTPKDFATALVRWEIEVDAALQAMMSATTAADLVEAWHDLVHLRLLATITLSAGRGARLSRLTWGAVFGHKHYILLRDKDTNEYSWTRMVPIVRMLRMILDEHAHDLKEFCRRAIELGLKTGPHRGKSFGDRAPHRMCFYSALITEHKDGDYVSRAAVDSKLLGTLSGTIFGHEINVGRHSLITLAVQHGFEPALLKVMTGHVRGQAEPFSDGQWIAAIDALKLLSAAMDWILAPICPQRSPRADLGVLALDEWTSSLRIAETRPLGAAHSRGRVLDEPFTAGTTLAIRVINHLRHLLANGQGPSDADARLLANLLLIQWTSLADARHAWGLEAPFQRIGAHCSALVMQREGCRAEIRRPLVGPAALALHGLDQSRPHKPWIDTLELVGAWLRYHLPALPWPTEAAPLGLALNSLIALWTRVHLPPFLMTAASARISAPTATRSSLYRLINGSKQVQGRDEVLVFSRPQPRGGGRVRVRPSPLKEAIAKVHEFGAAELREGENWQRMGDLTRELLAIDTSSHLPAATFVEWVAAEAALWIGSKGGRIKVNSVSTYTSNITSALESLRPDEDMREWGEEWLEFVAFLRATVTGETREEKDAARDVRTTAFNRFVTTLASIGYPIPDELLDAPVARGNDGMRKSAAATLLLELDRLRVTALMTGHFSDGALEHVLAPLYSELRWAFSFRSMEIGVLPLNAISCFLHLVVTTDGFAHLKSRHGRRLAQVPHSVGDRFHEAALAVARAQPGARWLFLLDNRNDWSMLDDFEEAFSAALKQASGEQDARPHAARAVSPLADLFPGWEAMLRRFLSGQASTDDCARFRADLRRSGFGALVAVLLKVGHGHPVTFLRYYFAIWDLLLSVFAQASLSLLPADPHLLARSHGTATATALRQAKHRKQSGGQPFDAWAWMTGYVPANSQWPHMKADDNDAPSRPHAQVKRASAQNDCSLEHQALYLALRITDEDSISAAHGASVATSVAARLESILDVVNVQALRERHQFQDSPRAKRSEVKYLRDVQGLALAKCLAEAAPETLALLGTALAPMRAGNYLLPPTETLRGTLIRFAACLPPTLAVLTQFRQGRLQAADVARLSDPKLRIHVGSPDRDLGERPRVFIVPVDDPFNLVARPRRTANVRSLIAAIQLIRDHLGSLAP